MYWSDTCGKMRDIFSEHCNMSLEQYEEISRRLIDLVCSIQMLEEKHEDVTLQSTQEEADELGVIFDFLYNTKELTIGEYNMMCNLVSEMAEEARKAVEG